MQSLYDFPAVYEAVLQRSHAVIAREVAALEELFACYGAARGSILELACGACPHGLLLAGQGYRVTGIDRSPAMLAEARRHAQAAGVLLRTVQANVVDFDLGRSDFSAAIFMFETFPLITAMDDLFRHFAAVHRHLRPGGLYVVDVDAPRQGKSIRTEGGEWGRRTVTLPGGWVETWNEDLPGDWVAGINRMALCCRICLDGKTYETRDEWRFRPYSPWDLALLARALAGWRLEGCYSWQDLGTDLAGEKHYLAVFVRC